MTERNVRVHDAAGPAVEDQEIEIVERKGVGHPDSICDGVAEAASRALARTYRERVGRYLHFNTDEAQLVAGESAPAFGGGDVIEPIYLVLVGRATKAYEGTRIPTETVALEAAREYLAEHVPRLEFGRDVVVDVKFGEGSGDLQGVFGREGVPMANDTSFGVGHAPYSETERVVLETERRVNREFNAVGPDVKVMGKREGDHLDLTVAAAVVDAFVDDLDGYRAVVEDVEAFVRGVAAEHTDRSVEVYVNTADDYDAGSVYLTVTGTSAEQGDDGSVGRGNRVSGLITPNRSMSIEATSGKNPVNHIGKIYNLLATETAHAVVEEVDGIRDLRVRLLSQIGRPIDRPHVADAHVVTEEGVAVGDVAPEIETIVDRELADVTSITDGVIAGDLSTF
ncbi:S-adenosylmethionine synthetase [Halobacteriales archaeon SW_5_70_135]|nr:MAG: S-adenosylmethionine synthetase [Halobacteriales archaeon SW_5_70_135]